MFAAQIINSTEPFAVKTFLSSQTINAIYNKLMAYIRPVGFDDHLLSENTQSESKLLNK